MDEHSRLLIMVRVYKTSVCLFIEREGRYMHAITSTALKPGVFFFFLFQSCMHRREKTNMWLSCKLKLSLVAILRVSFHPCMLPIVRHPEGRQDGSPDVQPGSFFDSGAEFPSGPIASIDSSFPEILLSCFQDVIVRRVTTNTDDVQRSRRQARLSSFDSSSSTDEAFSSPHNARR